MTCNTIPDSAFSKGYILVVSLIAAITDAIFRLPGSRCGQVIHITLATSFMLTLSGCVGAPTITDARGTRAFDQQGMLNEVSAGTLPTIDLNVCVIDSSSRSAIHKLLLAAYSAQFRDAVVAPTSQKGRLCDLEVRYPSIMGATKASLHSAYTGEKLAEAAGHFQLLPAMFAMSLQSSPDAIHRLAEQRAAANLPPLAPLARAPAASPKSAGQVAWGAARPANSFQGRPAAPAAATPAPGLSAADIERIAKAVQGAPPATPAESFPASPEPRFAAAERPADLAIIIGIENYSDIASKASYAERDADAFKSYARALGVPERNIILLKGSKAVRSALTKNVESWLPRMVKADSRVYFYFSGHGAPDVKTGQAYLVPWDGDPNFLDSTAYPVAQLYKKLGELPAKQVLVAMDSCFSGAGGRSVLASGTRPLVGKIDTGTVPSKLTVLAASGASEISGSLDDKGHGAFTYFLLEGLSAGKTTPNALAEYLTPRVQDEARRLNRDQTPQLQGNGAWSLR